MTQKYFIITGGPTGSGKTSLIDETLKQLGLPAETEYTKFLIDDLVENDLSYKNKVKLIIEKIDRDCEYEKEVNCEQEKYAHPSEELISEFNAAYYESRRVGCEDFRDEGVGCEKVLDSRLHNIKTHHYPVIVFEFVGQYLPIWLLSKEVIPSDYMVVASFSLVNIPVLVQRNTLRAYSSVLAFKQSKGKSPAPRLANVSAANFDKVVTNIIKTIRILFQCVNHTSETNEYHVDQCGQKPVDILLLFENNGSSHVLLYNSYLQRSVSEDQLTQYIQQSIRSTGGSRFLKRLHSKRRSKKRSRKNK